MVLRMQVALPTAADVPLSRESRLMYGGGAGLLLVIINCQDRIVFSREIWTEVMCCGRGLGKDRLDRPTRLLDDSVDGPQVAAR